MTIKTPSLAAALLSLGVVAAGCGPADRTAGEEGDADQPVPEAALSAVDADSLHREVAELAADSMLGRPPTGVGAERTVDYLTGAFAELGLEPGNDGSWTQEVPLVSITADPAMTRTVGREEGREAYDYGSEFMAWTKRVVDRVELEASEMVFVGYGIVAPEYGWDDYAGLDVEGRTVVMLVNDPGYATGDTALFNGNAMTYYGRWTYKFEEAARQGAAGAVVVHETGPAGYPWEVVSGSWAGPQFDLRPENDNMHRVRVEGWVTREVAGELFRRAGLDFEEMKSRAAEPGFEPEPLGLWASVTVENTLETATAQNVLGRLPGSERSEEHVIYTAHWDHLGVDPSLEGDTIYNGAKDNATGTAGLIEIARAFTELPESPARSVLFLAVTAEEQGLLGSKHYAQNPVYPLDETAAVINMDGLNVLGPMHDITVVGMGMSELDDYLARAAEAQDRRLRPDPEAEKGFYYRSDHFEFAKVGVPALYADAGVDHVEHGEEWTRERRDEWTTERYHKPADEYDPEWDLRGAVDDLRLFFRVGYRLATGSDFPEWAPGTEFEATRDSMMEAAGR